MKKRRWLAVITAISLLLFGSGLCFAQQGVMSGAGKLRVTQTEWFDIIYSEKNTVTAQILYEQADDIYRELAASYGIEPYFRLPVVITSTVEQFNAYQTNIPYNCIVLYDTAVIQDLAVFSQTIASTFTHELTHALTYNHKDGMYRAFAKLFGDAFAGYYITVTSGMAEGATVSYESSKGEGRLNDSYIMQMLRQAKIEDKFPTYSDVKGAADAYPANSFYYFNGAFAEYLQRTWGMEKYADFWYRCVNVKNLTVAGAFKKVYGIKLDKAWAAFEQDYYVPEVAGANPVETGQALDFFEPVAVGYSLKNNAGSLYSNLCSSSKGVYYIDETHSSVYFVDSAQLKECGAVKPKKLFRHDYIDHLSVSSDGRFAAVGFYSTMSSNVKHRAAVYDLQNKTWFTLEETNVVAPSMLMKDGQYYVAYQKYEPQKYSIVVQKLKIDKKLSFAEPFATLEFGTEEIPSDFTDLGDGRFAFIKKSGLEYSICIADFSLSDIKQFTAPLEGIKFRGLSAVGFSSQGLAFSWATKDSLPRLGFLDLKEDGTGEFRLSQENISGGVYNPVLYDRQLLYIATFYRQDRLLKLVEPQKNLLAINVEAEPVLESETEPMPVPDLPYKPFSPLQYAFEGLLLPVSITSGDTPWGLTYITSLPWTTGICILSGGYGFKNKTGMFSFEYQGGTGTSLFGYDLGSSLTLDSSGFKNLTGNAVLSSSFDFGTRSAVLFSAGTDLNYARASGGFDFNSQQSFVVTYSNLVSSGPGLYERSGFNFSAGIMHDGSYDIGFGLLGRIPKLIPITCVDGFTYNLPAKVAANLFPLSSGTTSAATVNAEALIFGCDIQRAVPYFSALYINDVILTLSYTGSCDYADSSDIGKSWHIARIKEYAGQLADNKLNYKDYMTLKLSLGFTPNVGAFADTRFRNNFYLAWSFGQKQNLPEKTFTLGLEASF